MQDPDLVIQTFQNVKHIYRESCDSFTFSI